MIGWRARAGAIAGLVATSMSCSTPSFVPAPFEFIPDPSPSDIAAVIFLVGDAGASRRGRSPLINRLRNDVERWSGLAPRDSSVAVFYLGDNVYPVGIRDRRNPLFPQDSGRLEGLIWAASGPTALRRGTVAHLVPGNHDWGNRAGARGVARLKNMEALVAELVDSTGKVRMTPDPGEPGPVAVDVGDAVRIMVLDTHWWLQSDDPVRKAQVLDSVGAIIGSAGDKPTIFAAHHPFETGGPHGGRFLDFFFLLRKTGAVVQDLNARVFADLVDGLFRTFQEAGRPLASVGGHDHSLQVMRTAAPGAPTWTLISGAGSKLTPVGPAPGLEWAGNRPGYMRLMVLRSGEVELFVDAAPEEFLRCPGERPAPCVARGVAAFETVYSRRLK